MDVEKTNLPDIEAVEKPRKRQRQPASAKVKANLEKGRLIRQKKLEDKRRAKEYAANLMREMKSTLLTMQEELREKRLAAIREKPVEVEPTEKSDEPDSERGFARLIRTGGLVLKLH